MAIYNIYKQLGETPLEALAKFKQRKNLSGSFTYAGRLDPMAEGVLLLVSGEDITEKEKYLKLPKTYRARVLFGFSTDTYDLLGLAKLGKGGVDTDKSQRVLQGFVGKHEFVVPSYSSVPHKGKPLFSHAQKGKLVSVEREMEIFSIQNIAFKTISKKNLQKYIEQNISKVTGDFRQEKILKQWESILAKAAESFITVTFTVSCASGTYIRSIAHELGKKVKNPSVLFSLKRMAVGKYLVTKSKR